MAGGLHDEVDVGSILIAVWRGWKLIAFGVALSLLFTMGFSFFSFKPHYQSTAVVTVEPHVFCPLNVFEDPDLCPLPIDVALRHVARNFSSVDFTAVVDDAIANQLSQLRAGTHGVENTRSVSLQSVTSIDISHEQIVVRVSYSDATWTVIAVNEIARELTNRLNALVRDVLLSRQRSLSFTLAALPSGSDFSSGADGHALLKRATVQAQIDYVSHILESERLAANVSLASNSQPDDFFGKLVRSLYFSFFVGLIVSIIAVLVFSSRQGMLYSIRSIEDELGESDLIIADSRSSNIAQEIRLATDIDSNGVLVITGHVPDAIKARTAVELCNQLNRASRKVMLLDLLGVSGVQSFDESARSARIDGSIETGFPIYAVSAVDAVSRIQELALEGGVVVVLAPSENVDLPLLREIFRLTNSRVFLCPRFGITRAWLERVLRLERGVSGSKVVVLIK